MIERVRLLRYKGFEDFDLRLGRQAVLVGPNNAGKTTLVQSLRLAASLLRFARRRNAYETFEDDVLEKYSRNVLGYPIAHLGAWELWPALLSAYLWLEHARGSGRYLREIIAPGVDTKFVERHRPLLAHLLRVPTAAAGFLTALGLSGKPETLRLRVDPSLNLAAGLSDLTARVDELVTLKIAAKLAVIVENEITFVSVPVPAEGLVLWGKGFEVDHAGSMPWLTNADIAYWGDVDTHGFAILNQLRAWLPQTRSVLMDRDTLLAHRDRWVTEATPTAARLSRLTADEEAPYHDLITDRLGPRVRLEQERIDWAWVAERLPY